jgi:hypothetical protein
MLMESLSGNMSNDDASETEFEERLTRICEMFTSSKKSLLSHEVSNNRRLLCNSVTSDGNAINGRGNFVCYHGPSCTYAHSLEEQQIDEKKLSIYRAILDQDYTSQIVTDPASHTDIYHGFISSSSICERCYAGECTGGYNCRNGACCHDLLICRNDILFNQCKEEVNMIKLSPKMIKKFCNFHLAATYPCCPKGHHLSIRGVPNYGVYLIQSEKQEHLLTDLDTDNPKYSDSELSLESELEEILSDMLSDEYDIDI